MEPSGSMPRSQGLSNKPYPEPSESNSSYSAPIYLRSILTLPFYLCPGFPRCRFPVSLPIKILKGALPLSIIIVIIINMIIITD